MQEPNLKRIFLYLLIASVSISALLGIVVILFGNFGETESKIMLTNLAVVCVSILGLACGVAFEASGGKILPGLGIVSSLVAGITWIILIWAERYSGEAFAKFVMTATLLAVAFSHLSLISLARLDKKFQWAKAVIFICVGTIVLISLGLIWLTDSFDSEFFFRLLGVLAITASALTIVIPVFHKLSDSSDKVSVIDAEIEKLKSRIAVLEKRREKISNNNQRFLPERDFK